MRACLYLFRDNLRLDDNPSLALAYERFDAVLPVILVPDEARDHRRRGRQPMGRFRRKFLVEAALATRRSLRELGTEALILRGDRRIARRLEELAAAHRIRDVVASTPRGVYERRLLKRLGRFAEVITVEDDVLIRAEDLPFAIEDLPATFSKFRRRVEARLTLRRPVEAPRLRRPFENKQGFGDDLEPVAAEPDARSSYPFIGGEDEADRRLNHYLWQSHGLARYKKTRNGLSGAEYSSKLSAYLARGNISPLRVYEQVRAFEEDVVKNDSTYWLIFELLWREFFVRVADKFGARIFQREGITGQPCLALGSEAAFDQWRRGETAHPFINALMKELVTTGFMSNRGRQVAASYLAHDLGVDWRLGAAFFEKHLIDYDVASNWGNWMYVAGVGHDPRSRVFNPDRQQQTYDPDGAFVNLWSEAEAKGRGDI